MTSSEKFTATPTQVEGVLIFEPSVLGDESNWLLESCNARDLSAAIRSDIKFFQDNQSLSKQWTLRGVHFQTEHPKGKLARVAQGSAFDVVVEVRKNSATYGKWAGIQLSAENRKQMRVPASLAHGFLVFSPTSEILYKTTDYYHPQSEVCLAWNDVEVNIHWSLPDGVVPILSAKDLQGVLVKQLVNNETLGFKYRQSVK